VLVACGVDVVSVKRFERLLEKYGSRLIKRLFPEGADYCFKKRRGELPGCLAARFALKEATVKAYSYAGVELPLSSVRVYGGGRELRLEVLGAPKRFRAVYSISHEREFAVAIVNLTELPQSC